MRKLFFSLLLLVATSLSGQIAISNLPTFNAPADSAWVPGVVGSTTYKIRGAKLKATSTLQEVLNAGSTFSKSNYIDAFAKTLRLYNSDSIVLQGNNVYLNAINGIYASSLQLGGTSDSVMVYNAASKKIGYKSIGSFNLLKPSDTADFATRTWSNNTHPRFDGSYNNPTWLNTLHTDKLINYSATPFQALVSDGNGFFVPYTIPYVSTYDTAAMLIPYKHWLAGYTPQTRTITTTTPLTGGGSLANNLTLGINLANTTTTGALTSTDWNTFNNKWDPNGNTITSGQYLGTNNTQDLVFKANNIEIGRYAVGTLGWDFGFNSTATGAHAVNFGENGIASNLNSFNSGLNGTASGQYSFNTGVGGRAIASYTVNTGQNGLASGFYSTNTALNGTASGFYSFNAGRGGVTSNFDAVNFGVSATCSGISSFNSGASSTVSGTNSFNSGASGTVSGFRAINLGYSSGVVGQSAFNSGAESTVSGNYGINLGRQGTVNGLNGFNSGLKGRADGDYSFNTANAGTAYSYGEHSLGLFPTAYTPSSATSWVATDRLFNIGNGVIGNTSNAFTILKNGNTFILGKVSQPTTPNSPVGDATLVNGTVTISNTLATTGCKIDVKYRTGTALTSTSSILVVTNVTNSTGFTVTAYNAGAATTNTLDNNQIEYTISN